ncbi:hypothetical protein [Pseudomonas tohonis]|uniref:hypothetical protein n=1 Tax=Pseudomonas tohonis TaxID=2725477 RepID=UPI001F19A9B1|nr:hypothetical protein [Pseudomonas tohonis]
MSEQPGLAARKFGEHEVIIRELTVADVRALMGRAPDNDLLGAALFEEIALVDLPAFTSLTAEKIELMRPSELRQVISACKEVNQDFFGMLARQQKRMEAR